MSTRADQKQTPVNLNRRRFVKALASGASLCLSPTLLANGLGPVSRASDKKRLAIIGGGMSGIASAWLCNDEFTVDLFEARHKLGGHCDSRLVQSQGAGTYVDLGAQFFHPGTHPLYMSLLEYMGLYSELNPEINQVVETKGSLTVFDKAQDKPMFNSKWALSTPLRSIDFGIYTQEARRFIIEQNSFDITLEHWVEELPVQESFKRQVLTPLLASFAGTTIKNALTMSARSVLQLVALAFPSSIFKGATTFNSNIGLQGILMELVKQFTDVNINLQSPVEQLISDGKNWFVISQNRSYGPFDDVIVTAPAEKTKDIFQSIPWAQDITESLSKFTYFDAKIAIHKDPVYMHQDKSYWSAYNAKKNLDSCEGSVWYGQYRNGASGEPLALFKSWALNRRNQPKKLITERSFRHPLITPSVVEATRKLLSWQGTNGLWFAGQYTTGVDLQETAFYSALRVARKLCQDSKRLNDFSRFIKAKNLDHISYDV